MYHISSAPKRIPNIRSETVQIQGKEESVKNNITMNAGPSYFNIAWRDMSRRLPETTGHMSSRAETNREDREKNKTRTASCTIASLPRVTESRRQPQTGANGRSVRPKRGETTSRQLLDKTTRQNNKEITRLWKKTTMRCQATWKHRQPPPGNFRHFANS